MTYTFTVKECWFGGWLGPSTLALEEGRFRFARDGDPEPQHHVAGTVIPGFQDAHVHLGLVDSRTLVAGGITVVNDLGWDLSSTSSWLERPDLPDVEIAGQLLTVAGGYPSRSGWAPPAACCTVASPRDARSAVGAQLEAGASLIKVALNTDAGPVLDDATLAAIVAAAHAVGLPVVAHAQGIGEAERAWQAGVDRLAHTPWSERLGDELISHMAGSQTWISTLDIHGWGEYGNDFAVAQDNLRRFHAAGGRILYGTDLGNGPLPVGINRRELLALHDAGVVGDALFAAVTAKEFGRRLSWSPRDLASQAGVELVDALAGLTALDTLPNLTTDTPA